MSQQNNPKRLMNKDRGLTFQKGKDGKVCWALTPLVGYAVSVDVGKMISMLSLTQGVYPVTKSVIYWYGSNFSHFCL